MKVTHAAEIVKLSHVAEIVKLTHVARILEAGSMYDPTFEVENDGLFWDIKLHTYDTITLYFM